MTKFEEARERAMALERVYDSIKQEYDWCGERVYDFQKQMAEEDIAEWALKDCMNNIEFNQYRMSVYDELMKYIIKLL